MISISDHFTFKNLLRFTIASIVMMIISSIYSVVDGFFISNFAGKTAFSSVNFITPVLMILGSIGFMFGTGGSALVAKTMGEGDDKKANEIFSMLIYTAIACGIVLAIAAFIFMPAITRALGAEEAMIEGCVTYGRIIILALPAFILQYAFQSFMVTAEKPKLGLKITLAAGVTNMVLDALLIAVLKLGVTGAALATALGQCVGGIIPLIYFSRPNSSRLKICKMTFDGKALVKACTNGASELMTNVAQSLVSILYNIQLLSYIGEDGVSAYGVVMYVGWIFAATFTGYSVGSAPIISYNYGAGNTQELKNVLRKSLTIILTLSVFMMLAAEVFAYPLSMLYVGYDETLLEITLNAFRIYSFSFCFMGLSIYGSSFFTALNNGLISATISFLRTLVFQVIAILILPLIFGVNGLWFSTVVAELVSAILTIIFMLAFRKRYNY